MKPITIRLNEKSTNLFGISINTIRKIYISHYFHKWGGKKSKLMVLAKQMLHDPQTAYDNYVKFVNTSEDVEGVPESSRMAQERTTAKEIATQTEPTTNTIETQTDKDRVCGDKPFTPILYSKEYKRLHPEKARQDSRTYFEKHKHDVLRSKLLRNLQRGHTKVPSQASIITYKLKRNSNGEWY